MHVTTKKIAIAGLLAAFSCVLLMLGFAIESSSLFLIAAASFCVGIAVREWGNFFGAAFWAASTLLNLILAPNKMYCFTFAAMGLYLLLSEWLWLKIAFAKGIKHRTVCLWIGKYIIFNGIYLPVLVLLRDFIFVKAISNMGLVIVFLAGQIGLWIYDKAYIYFQGTIWGKIRMKVL